MNAILAIVGALLITVAAIRGLMAHAAIEFGTIPRDLDKRIVKEGDKYWTEDYHSFPGWKRRDVFNTLEAAKENKARWDAIHNAKIEVIK